MTKIKHHDVLVGGEKVGRVTEFGDVIRAVYFAKTLSSAGSNKRALKGAFGSVEEAEAAVRQAPHI